eukprot:3636845-Rhodomonas_salina.2
MEAVADVNGGTAIFGDAVMYGGSCGRGWGLVLCYVAPERFYHSSTPGWGRPIAQTTSAVDLFSA